MKKTLCIHLAESYKVPQREAKEAEKIYCSLRECQLGISWGQEGQKVTSSNFTDIEAATRGTSSHKQFWKKPSGAKKYGCK